jgi:pimeloyl-ACP methyl ester carboxylesterase
LSYVKSLPMRRLVNLLLVAVGVSVCTGIAAPAVLTQREVTPYLHPQRLVDVGGHKINLYCTGHGSPTAILDAGEGETMFTWRRVQPAIAKFTRVCSFDRAGMGFSGGGPLPRDANAMVTDLHTLLQRAHVAAPYVLVGHSIAGLYALLYADRYLQQVAGMVLVDPSFPNQTQALHAASPAMKHMEASGGSAYTFCYQAALHGELSVNRGSKAYAICGFPPHTDRDLKAQCTKNGAAWCELAHLSLAQLVRPTFWLALGSEDGASYATDSAEDLKEQRSYGAMPLTVLTAANDIGGSPLPPSEMRAVQRVWTAGHDRLARLSSVGVNFVIPRSEHLIQIDRPTVVTAAVAEVVSQAKR